MGHDVGARVADRLTAIKELLKLGYEGPSDYLAVDEYDFDRLSDEELDALVVGLAALRDKIDQAILSLWETPRPP